MYGNPYIDIHVVDDKLVDGEYLAPAPWGETIQHVLRLLQVDHHGQTHVCHC